jgi:hypothetical protein
LILDFGLILKVKSPADGWIAAINFRLDQELVEESGLEPAGE